MPVLASVGCRARPGAQQRGRPPVMRRSSSASAGHSPALGLPSPEAPALERTCPAPGGELREGGGHDHLGKVPLHALRKARAVLPLHGTRPLACLPAPLPGPPLCTWRDARPPPQARRQLRPRACPAAHPSAQGRAAGQRGSRLQPDQAAGLPRRAETPKAARSCWAASPAGREATRWVLPQALGRLPHAVQLPALGQATRLATSQSVLCGWCWARATDAGLHAAGAPRARSPAPRRSGGPTHPAAPQSRCAGP